MGQREDHGTYDTHRADLQLPAFVCLTGVSNKEVITYGMKNDRSITVIPCRTRRSFKDTEERDSDLSHL